MSAGGAEWLADRVKDDHERLFTATSRDEFRAFLRSSAASGNVRLVGVRRSLYWPMVAGSEVVCGGFGFALDR